MHGIYQHVEDLVGNTPLLELERCPNGARILAKLEYLNPAGSVKDRAALSMVRAAQAQGLLKPGSVIIEPTSGNTGIGLAFVAASQGYRLILTMPDTMSKERRAMLSAYGAQLELTPGALGMQGAVDRALELARTIPGSFIPSQFENPANPDAHYRTTGPEIWQDCQGDIDAFVACVGTGGTVTGTGRFLKEQRPGIRVIAVEPSASPLLSGGTAAPHKIQGIGANFVPAILDRSLLDEVVQVDDQDALDTGRALAQRFGLLVGISSGAALCAARQVAARAEFSGKTIVVLFPDSGDRYLSSPMFQAE